MKVCHRRDQALQAIGWGFAITLRLKQRLSTLKAEIVT